MKRFILLCIFILPCILFSRAHAQQIQQDSISIETLLSFVETNTSYRIFAEIDNSFMVSVQDRSIEPLQLLRNALADSPYRVSFHNNNLFVLRGAELDTQFSPVLAGKTQQPDDTFVDFRIRTERIEAASFAYSENLIYSIGDPHRRDIPQEVTLRGQVIDSRTREPLIGVNLVLREPFVGVITDIHGNYSIRLPSGRVQLDISGMNIQDSRRQLMLFEDGIFNIELIEDRLQLDELTVVARRLDNVRNVQLGTERIQVAGIRNIPTAFGEVDLLRVLQSLPGVTTVGEASTGFNVRGGATDQNLILLNNGTIFNPNHFFGLFSAFNADMITEAELFKSSVPARYGGRISSVLDITGKEANKERFTGTAGLGLITSNLTLEIPIIRNRTSLLVSGRTTYSDWLLGQLPERSDFHGGTAGFYDMGAIFSHHINERNHLNVFGYHSRNHFSFNEHQQFTYSNFNASARWRRAFSDHLLGNFSAGYDRYDFSNTDTMNEAAGYRLSFDINQLFARADFMLDRGDHRINFGLQSILYEVAPGNFEPAGENSLVEFDRLQRERALETALYLENEWTINQRLSATAGIRFTMFNALGPRTFFRYNPDMLPYLSTIIDTVTVRPGGIVHTYFGPEFRLSARYMLASNLSVKAGFNTMRQHIHKLSNTVIMSPTDTWKLSDANIRPQRGWQVATGLYFDTPNRVWSASMELYYREMRDYLDYRGGARILMNHHIETDVISTEGHAYGIEFSLRRDVGRLTGWTSYTFSRTFLRQSDALIAQPINNGNWYAADYDRPHMFNFTGNFAFTRRYSLSLNVDYGTGRPITIPAGQFYNPTLGTTQIFFTDRNSYRVPDYFRMDLSFNIQPRHRLTLLTHSSLSFGVYNVTGRRNAHSIFFVAEEGEIRGYKLSIFAMPIPFIMYNIRF